MSMRTMELATVEAFHRGRGRGTRGDDWDRELLAFRLADEEYAVDILKIREIIKLRPITEVPRAPAFVPGIISVRGTIIPVVDLRMRLRLPMAPASKDARVLIVMREAGKSPAGERLEPEPYGLIVDAVRQVVRLRDEEIEPTPAMLGGSETEFLAGIGRPRDGRMLILVDLEAVLAFASRPAQPQGVRR